MRYELIPVRDRYWKIGSGAVRNALRALKDVTLADGDVVLLSEKAVAVAEGELIDESEYVPGRLARWLAKYWMRIVWGRILGPLLKDVMDPPLRDETIENFRRYPLEEGARHKQMVLEEFGLKHALEPLSEAGVDVGNVPGTYAAPVPESAREVAEGLRERLMEERGVNVSVVVGDTDKTFELFGVKFTTIARAQPPIKAGTGVVGFLVGRLLARTLGPTPVAVAGDLSVEEAIRLLERAENVRTKGAGRTVYDMVRKAGDPSEVDEEFLSSFEHVPIVVARVVSSAEARTS